MSVDSTPSPDAVERPDDSDASDSYDAGRTEQATTPQPGGEDTRGQRSTETLTREEYADAMRAGGLPIQDSRDGHQAADGSESRRRADTEAERPADQGPAGTHDREARDIGTRADSGEPEHTVRAAAEPLTREEYADAMRGSGHAARADDGSLPEASGDATDRPPAYDETDAAAGAEGTPESPESRQAGNGAHSQDLDTGHPPDGSAAVPVVTHFRGEFKGRPLDLYTDGTRWAAADTPDMEETVSEKGDMPDRQPAGEEPADNTGEGSSLLERLRREVYEESDDELDILEKEANLVHDVFSRPPTGTHEGTAPNQPYIHGTQPSGIDAGSVATAVFTLGLVIDRTARWVMQHYENHAKGR
jgi:hypothetical protein